MIYVIKRKHKINDFNGSHIKYRYTQITKIPKVVAPFDYKVLKQLFISTFLQAYIHGKDIFGGLIL